MGTSVESITQAINETIYKLSGKTTTNRNVLEAHNNDMLRSQTTRYRVHRANNIRITTRCGAPTEHCGVQLKKESSRNNRTHGLDRSSLSSNTSRTPEQHQGDTVITARKDFRFSGRDAETDQSKVYSGKRSKPKYAKCDENK